MSVNCLSVTVSLSPSLFLTDISTPSQLIIFLLISEKDYDLIGLVVWFFNLKNNRNNISL